MSQFVGGGDLRAVARVTKCRVLCTSADPMRPRRTTPFTLVMVAALALTAACDRKSSSPRSGHSPAIEDVRASRASVRDVLQTDSEEIEQLRSKVAGAEDVALTSVGGHLEVGSMEGASGGLDVRIRAVLSHRPGPASHMLSRGS